MGKRGFLLAMISNKEGKEIYRRFNEEMSCSLQQKCKEQRLRDARRSAASPCRYRFPVFGDHCFQRLTRSPAAPSNQLKKIGILLDHIILRKYPARLYVMIDSTMKTLVQEQGIHSHSTVGLELCVHIISSPKYKKFFWLACSLVH